MRVFTFSCEQVGGLSDRSGRNHCIRTKAGHRSTWRTLALPSLRGPQASLRRCLNSSRHGRTISCCREESSVCLWNSRGSRNLALPDSVLHRIQLCAPMMDYRLRLLRNRDKSRRGQSIEHAIDRVRWINALCPGHSVSRYDIEWTLAGFPRQVDLFAHACGANASACLDEGRQPR